MDESNRDQLLPILTLAEVAKHLRCSKAQVSNLTNGKIAGVPKLLTVKYGKLKVVRRQTLDAWIEARESEAANGPAEGDQNAVSADSGIQRNMDIIAALDRGDRKCAVELWQKRQRSAGLPFTKAFLYEDAAQDKADYYRWARGKKADGSQAERDIRGVLLKPFS